MSNLKFELHKNEFLMDKVTKKLFFVVSIDLHNVILREEVEGDESPLKKTPKHMVNLSMIKVKPDVMKVLYGTKDGVISPDNIPDLPKDSSTDTTNSAE